MQEVQPPKKPMAFYYILVLAVMLLFNEMARPYFDQAQIEQVDYGTFMDMTENQQISQVEIKDNQILFTNKDDTQVYKTGLMDDPDLIYRLKDSGAEFSSEIVEQMSPFLSFLLTWLLPRLAINWLFTITSIRIMAIRPILLRMGTMAYAAVLALTVTHGPVPSACLRLTSSRA